jgi:hypothetical protein
MGDPDSGLNVSGLVANDVAKALEGKAYVAQGKLSVGLGKPFNLRR